MATVFVTLKDVVPAPNAAGDTVVFTVDTDYSVQLRFTVWDAQNPSVTAGGQESSAKVGRRTFSYPLGPISATPQGKTMGFEITSVTTPPPTLRPYQGTVRIPAARTVSNGKAVPTEFYGFTVTPPVLNYTWAQYNPNGTSTAIQPPSLKTPDPARREVVLSSVQPKPSEDGDDVVFSVYTEVAGPLMIDMWDMDDPQNEDMQFFGADDAEVSPCVGQRNITVRMLFPSEPVAGKTFGYRITVGSWDPQPFMRPVNGVVQMPGARDLANRDIPVRFYAFSGPMTAPVDTPGERGNWSTYTWSQWNPKGT